MSIGVLQQYRELLPLNEETPIFSMGEGDTPLVRSRRLGPQLGCPDLFFKLEGCNPTGSFKDRGMVVAIAKAMEENCVGVMCASTGNTSASAAAYSAYCGLACWVLIPKGEVALGKLAQAMAYGARILLVDGNFDAALALVRRFTETHPITLVNSVNPHRIEGQKTAAFEISDTLDDAPDYLFIPVGNAGNITAYWRGFVEYHQLGRNDTLPRMMGYQAAGAAPIVRGEPVPFPQTIASAIRIGNPASWKPAERARDQSGGVIDAVSDDEILEALPPLGLPGRHIRRARIGGIRGRPAQNAARRLGTGRQAGSLHHHRQRPQRPRYGREQRPGRHGRSQAQPRGHRSRHTGRCRPMTAATQMNRAAVEVAIGTVLKYIDEDSGREGLWRTPRARRRNVRRTFRRRRQKPAAEIDAVFSDNVTTDPVVVRAIPFYSMCEHHLLPFFGHASLAYVPNRHIAGISKIARALDIAARRLQVQERLTAPAGPGRPGTRPAPPPSPAASRPNTSVCQCAAYRSRATA